VGTFVKRQTTSTFRVPPEDENSKAIPLQPLTGPENSRKLKLPDFKTIST
jgi:hypothetical protein